MSSQRRSVVPGVVLIVIGTLIVASKFDYLDFRFRDIFPYAFIALGIWFFYKLLARNQRGAAFPATFFVLLGVFFLLRRYSYQFWRFYDFHDLWPVFLLIIGLAFLVQFVFRPKEWALLIPSTIFLLAGSAFLARNMDWYYLYDLEYYLSRYWPLVLILIGVGLITSNLRRKADSS